MSTLMADLSQLKDIHISPPPGWWPPALGWWLLLATLIFIAILAIFLVRTAKKTKRFKQSQQALKLIKGIYRQDQNQQQLVNQLSGWLKQVALVAFPDHQTAPLHGNAWLEFLDKTGITNQFTQGQGQVFGHDMYAGQFDVDPKQLLSLCNRWLSQVKLQLMAQGK